jgi:hypothetical protein
LRRQNGTSSIAQLPRPIEDTAAAKLNTGAALFAADKESRLPLARKRTQRVDCEMELPYALTGNKGIVTQTGAQYLNCDGSRIGVVLILRAGWPEQTVQYDRNAL